MCFLKLNLQRRDLYNKRSMHFNLQYLQVEMLRRYEYSFDVFLMSRGSKYIVRIKILIKKPVEFNEDNGLICNNGHMNGKLFLITYHVCGFYTCRSQLLHRQNHSIIRCATRWSFNITKPNAQLNCIHILRGIAYVIKLANLQIVLVCCTVHHLIIIIVQTYLKASNLYKMPVRYILSSV